MDILYVSALSSEKLINDIYIKSRVNPGFAVQKFSRSFVKGMIQNGANCMVLSSPPIPSHYLNSTWVSFDNEKETGVNYHYVPFLNLPFLKHICVFLYSFFFVLKWKHKASKESVVICDVLCISLSSAVLLASKLCRVKSVAIVTDIYSQIVGSQHSGYKGVVRRMARALNKLYVQSFSMYVLLTEAMNELVNPKKHPYVVMEALCDVETQVTVENTREKRLPKVVLYAGGLEERYGLKMLVESFKLITDASCELHIYGSGTYAVELQANAKVNNRIKYFGVQQNDEILRAETKATLLVNPRFSTEEFTKYSFPSKNMEYMLSGTPMVTTRLPGMPNEYLDYVFLFNEETIEGYANTLSNILSYPESKLWDLGQRAKSFVIASKNCVCQTKRVLELITKNL